jgi:class 3 adenylate cyclase/tetratricopeptide (TPR) repeat protein
LVPARFASPANYTPRHIAERILTSRSAQEGEHKHVTVLFCDISDSTALAERLGPEMMFALVNRFFDVALEHVHHYEGTINQFLGDGFMALFGAPLALEHHEQRAALAALALRDGILDRLPELRNPDGTLLVRLALNSGLVVVGKIGDNLRMDYTAVGDTTNVAARLQALAMPGTILLSHSTRERIEDTVITEPLPPVMLKGKAQPVSAYRLVARRADSSVEAPSPATRQAVFVARARELAELREALDHAESGRGQVIGVVGEAGLGKSRLLSEFRRGLDGRNVTYLEGHCVSYGETIPYLPILELFRNNCRIGETDTPEVAAAKVEGALRAVDLDVSRSLPYLLHLIGLKGETGSLEGLTAEAIKTRTFDTLRQLSLKGSTRRPIVFVVEDIHWIDRTSEEFLALMAESMPRASILLIATYRPGYAPPWLHRSYATQIALRPLADRDASDLVRQVLAHIDVTEAATREILARGEGNPLFLEELARTVSSNPGRGGEPGIPDTLHGVLTARVDRLPDDLKVLLQIASVVGREFSSRVLAALSPNPEHVDEQLQYLARLEFLHERTWESEALYGFKHVLIRDAVYASLLESRRREYHTAVGRALEGISASRIDEAVDILAYHFGLGDDDQRAVGYAIRAADRAQRRWANAEAVALTEAALRRLARMPESAETRGQRIAIVLKQAEVRFALGEHAGQIRALEDLRDAVATSGTVEQRAAWHYWLGFLYSLTGTELELAISHCGEALAIAESAGLEDLQAYAQSCLAQVFLVAGRLQRGLELGESALAVFEAKGHIWWACRTLSHLSPIANALGDWRRGFAYCRRALDHGLALDDLRLKVSGLLRTASTHIQQGNWQQGLRLCEEALALGPTPFDAAAITAIRGYGMVKAGRILEGTDEIERALTWYERSHLSYTRSLFSLWLADGYLRSGQRDRARAVAGEVATSSAELAYRHLLAVANRLLGESLSAEDPVAATRLLTEAERALDEIGVRNELAKTWVAQARLATSPSAARVLLEQALGVFQELGTIDGAAHVRELLDAS